MDEMQISPGIEYDLCLKSFISHVCDVLQKPANAEEAEERIQACHALVFMAKGLADNWKQVIGGLFEDK